MALGSGGGLKGMMVMAMVFVFGGAAFVSARDFQGDLCDLFVVNGNVVRRVGEVLKCGVAPGPSFDAKKIVLRVRGGMGEALIAIERKDGRVTRAYLTTREQPRPELVYGADPLVPTSYVGTN